ncbi:beta-1,3-galactosyl-O-glycosyl-glycoprotein beta-1,6-N-acetylglucosaminyltransferase 3-like [Hyla sarda]|uniref:beta-1,3-galactosyl-O-glycosyl-glycoprotein beta-1,6-N-acetylglucosaminyltransferase 3-like n=1 Tax=Hyla sarda TaxID=327740 RepID=UPI0024C3C1BB|nr:beta-1,3-galactosyl-O-glycosyl-glycoprotein beta-1,6-N-acetylglucosaminyltransferase 3-like [Hyla sarda]
MVLRGLFRIAVLQRLSLVFVTGLLLHYIVNEILKSLNDIRTKRLQETLVNVCQTFPELDCLKVIKADREALLKAQLYNLQSKKERISLTEEYYLNITQDCAKFRTTRKYIYFALSKEEEEFPIAYSMVIHENIEMFERLLRAIYAPQNIYCIHVDKKSPEIFKESVRTVASCFDNVFVASKLEKVVYSSWSRVQADLNCMEDLLKSIVKWKYLLNTCGTDFPLKTNSEIVTALKLLNGKNNMESMKTPQVKMVRWLFHHEVLTYVRRTNFQKSPPPINVPMFSGGAYIVLSRDFVKHIFESPNIQEFIKWEKDTYSPDEHFWATVNRMPEVPGAIPYHEKYDVSDLNSISRVVKWSYEEGDVYKGALYPPCTGIHRRMICIYGSGDLNWLLKQHHLFANKFDPAVDDIAIQCLEKYLRYKALVRKDI